MKDRQDSIYKGFFSIVIPIVIQYLMSSMVGASDAFVLKLPVLGVAFILTLDEMQMAQEYYEELVKNDYRRRTNSGKRNAVIYWQKSKLFSCSKKYQ